MGFMFRHSHLCVLRTSSLCVVVLGFHWSKKDIRSKYDIIISTFQPTLECVFEYIYKVRSIVNKKHFCMKVL